MSGALLSVPSIMTSALNRSKTPLKNLQKSKFTTNLGITTDGKQQVTYYFDSSCCACEVCLGIVDDTYKVPVSLAVESASKGQAIYWTETAPSGNLITTMALAIASCPVQSIKKLNRLFFQLPGL